VQPCCYSKVVQKMDSCRFFLPHLGRLRADPGKKHEPRVAISRSAKNHYPHLVACPSVKTGSFVTAESGVRLLTKAAIEEQPFAGGRSNGCTVPKRVD
jgi:hypothetical protein